MLRSFTKKRLLVVVSVVGVMAGAGTAFAYYTTSGAGTGSASTGGSSTLTISSSISGVLYPGTSTTVLFTANNPSPGHQQIGTITLTGIKACSGSGSSWNGTACSNSGTEQTTCEDFSAGASNDTAKDFYMAPVVENQDLPSGTGTGLTNSGTLVMNDLNSSQNLCKGANLYLSFSS